MGFPKAKIFGVPPVIDFELFYNRKSNGSAIMNTGATIPKKKMKDFVDLARLVPNKSFNLYPMGYDVHEISQYNESRSAPITVHPAVPMSQMPAIYKKNEWMVYTACPKMKTVGWPMAVGEAQAAGVGVCMANIRPDIKEYVGEAGFTYDSLEQAAEIIRQPFSKKMRAQGFEHAKEMDIHRHKYVLTDLWESRI